MDIIHYVIDKIFDLTVELYCKVKNLIFQISLNQFDNIIFLIKKKGGPYCFLLYVCEIWAHLDIV